MEESRDIRVLSHTTWDQRKVYYEEVEALLLRGFLSCYVDLPEVRVGFRSLGPSDLSLLRYRADVLTSDLVWKSWVVAEAVWIIGGQIVLEDYNMSAKLQPFFAQLPKDILNTVYQEVTALHSKGEGALDAAESFCYEDHSRRLWKSFGGRFNGGAGASGIPGAGRIPLNSVQKLWIYFNTVEDEREQEIKDWNNAKLIVSAQNPKAGRSLNARERSILRRERNRRQEAQDRFYYTREGVLDEDGKLRGQAVILKASKTVEELQDEFHRWREGDKDFHDEVVESYKRKIREGMEQQRREMAFLRQEIERRALAAEEDTETRRSALVGYTPEQMQEILKEKGLDKRRGARKIVDGGAYKQTIYDRFVKDDPLKYPEGGLMLDAKGHAVPIEPEKKDLGREIAGRRVTADRLFSDEG